jgi:hypothetical protein
MAKPDKPTIKAFAIALAIGSILKSYSNGDPRIVALQLQIRRASRVFSMKAGSKMYFDIADKVGKSWQAMLNKNDYIITEEDTIQFVEFLGFLISPEHYKKFLGVSQYRANLKTEPEAYRKIAVDVLQYEHELNRVLGTKPYTMSIFKKKEKVKVKKERSKPNKSKTKTKAISGSKLKEAQRKASVRSFLRDKIKQAKESNETTT